MLKTSTGEEMPFKLFSAEDSEVKDNMWNEENSTDFAFIERRFAESKVLEFSGAEKIENQNDVAWLFKGLEDEAIEHAFLVYHFKDQSYFVQHISTGGIDSSIVDNKVLIGNILHVEPESITLVHNHPSGNLIASKADFKCLENLVKALQYSDVKVNPGVIINLRSGNYLVFDENHNSNVEKREESQKKLQEITQYSFSKQVFVKDFQPIKISSNEDVAKYLSSQKFGVSDKTEMLVLNNQMHIVGKFIMPPQKQVEFVIDKISRFGGTNCIIYGNNISPEEINFYNERLKYSSMSILDGFQFKSENGEKIFRSFMGDNLIDRDRISNEIADFINEPQEKNDREIIGGKIKDIAEASIKNPEYLKQFDKNTQNTINQFIKNQKPNVMENQKELDQENPKNLEANEKKEKFNLDDKVVEGNLNDSGKIETINTQTKQNDFIIEDIGITPEQRRNYNHFMEFGSAEGYYPLSKEQLSKIPDIIDGNKLSSYEKMDLAMGGLDLTNSGFFYELRENKILKIDLNDDSEKFLTKNNIIFNNQNPNKMETKEVIEQIAKEFSEQFINEVGDKGFEKFQQYYQNLEPEYKKIFLNEVENEIFQSNVEPENRIETFHIAQENLEAPIRENRIININNQNPQIMENKNDFDQVEYLKNQVKYLGFGEAEILHKDLEKGISSEEKNFEIKTTSDKSLPENTVDFTLNFSKSEKGGVFFNSYQAELNNEKGETHAQKFYVNKENTFTAKEAVNLLEGRAVKIEFTNPKTDQKESAFVKLDFKEKNEYGNYNFQNFHQNYGVDTAKIVEKSELIFDQPEYKENTIKNLEKGNVVKVKFNLDDKVVEGNAVLNPQYKNLNLYDKEMNRLNTNKPLEGLDNDNKHQKGNVREQSMSRGH
jgi:hypothetical protein